MTDPNFSYKTGGTPWWHVVIALVFVMFIMPMATYVLYVEWVTSDIWHFEPVLDSKTVNQKGWTFQNSNLWAVFGDMVEAGREEISKTSPWYWALGATDYYASPTGSGATCSFASPCSISTAACGKQCSAFNPQPDDRIWAEQGTYTFTGSNFSLIWFRQSGTLGHPIVYRNYNNGHVLIDCGYITANAALKQQACTGNPFYGSGNTGDSQYLGSGNYVTIWGFDFDNLSTTSRACIDIACNTDVVTMNEPFVNTTGMSYINCFFRNQIDGLQFASNPPPKFGTPVAPGTTPSGQLTPGGTNHVIRGNFSIYNGEQGGTRSYGHSYYIQNWIGDLEGGRVQFIGNIGLRAFNVGMQVYSTTASDVAYITGRYNVEAAQGYKAYPLDSRTPTAVGGTAWPAVSCCADVWYIGTDGAVSAGCPWPDGGTGSTKTLFKNVWDSNQAYDINGVSIGGAKGVCDSQFINNYIDSVGMSWTNGAMFAPWTFTGNTIMWTPNGSGGPTPLFTALNYPSNIYLAGEPASGKQFFYHANDDEGGRGMAVVYNYDLSPNVTIDPSQMGCYQNEPIRIFNGQNNKPYSATPVATQTGCATISVSATTATREVPGLTTDGTNPYPTPPDLGPKFNVYVMYPDFTQITSTVTPTPSASPTVTPTPTITVTSTPSFTPSLTSTASPTFTLTPTNTVTNTPTFTPSKTPTATATPLAGGLSFSVSTCTFTAPMALTADSTAPGGFYGATTQAEVSFGDAGKFVCPFTVPVTTRYRMWAAMKAADSSHDSYHVTYDSEVGTLNNDIFDIAEQRDCDDHDYQHYWGLSNYFYNIGNSRATTLGALNNCSNPQQANVAGYERSDGGPDVVPGVTLTAGAHTITFWGREPSAQIAFVYITADPNFNPNIPPNPTPTPPNKTWCKCGHSAKMVGGRYTCLPCPFH